MAYFLLAVVGAVFAFGMGALVSFITDERVSASVRWFSLAALVVLTAVCWSLTLGLVSTLP